MAKEKLATTHMTLLQGPKDPVLPTLALGPMYVHCTYSITYIVNSFLDGRCIVPHFASSWWR